MTHSPLPWTKKSEFTAHWFLRDANAETICLIAQTKQIPEPSNDPEVSLTRTVKLPHADSNAALFLAAPKLLAILKEAVEVFRIEVSQNDSTIAKMDAAIAEAETP